MYRVAVVGRNPVAPFTGAWIEMRLARIQESLAGRSLHGSVD